MIGINKKPPKIVSNNFGWQEQIRVDITDEAGIRCGTCGEAIVNFSDCFRDQNLNFSYSMVEASLY